MPPIQFARRRINADASGIDLVGVDQHPIAVQLDTRPAETHAKCDKVVLAIVLEGVRCLETPTALIRHHALIVALANRDDLATSPVRTPDVKGDVIDIEPSLDAVYHVYFDAGVSVC